MTFPLSEKYLDMLIQQSYSNEDKAGSNADSVASKLESIKQQIVSEHKVIERLKDEIQSMELLLQKEEKYLKNLMDKNSRSESISESMITCNRIRKVINGLKLILDDKPQ